MQNYLELFHFKSSVSSLVKGPCPSRRPSQRNETLLIYYNTRAFYTNCTVYMNFSRYFIIRNFENFKVKLNKPDFVRKLADAEVIFSHASQDCYRMHHFHQLKTHMTPFE